MSDWRGRDPPSFLSSDTDPPGARVDLRAGMEAGQFLAQPFRQPGKGFHRAETETFPDGNRAAGKEKGHLALQREETARLPGERDIGRTKDFMLRSQTAEMGQEDQYVFNGATDERAGGTCFRNGNGFGE